MRAREEDAAATAEPAPESRSGKGRLVLRGLSKRYADFTAVDAIDLEVNSGEFLTLLGPSGSGKTTTLMMVAGFTPPSSGEILIDGRYVADVPPEQRDIGVVFQNYALFPHMSVFDNVSFPLRMRRVPAAGVRRGVEEALALVRLSGLGGRFPGQLSGGQQQRVALARALVFNPRLLLMDEPLGALDKKLREQMQFEIKRLHDEVKVTVVYVTHDQEEALTMSDRVAVMNEGHIEQLGAAEEIYERPQSRFVAEFIGEANLVEGRLDGTTGGGAPVLVSARGTRFRVDADHAGADSGTQRLLVLRPEKISLLEVPHGGSDGDEALPGTIAELIYVGDFTRYRVQVEDGLLLSVKVSNRKATFRGRPGDRVRLVWDPADVSLLST